jgi:hypothetical protein
LDPLTSTKSIEFQSIAPACAHAGKVGHEGAWLRDELKKEGIDTDDLQLIDVPTAPAIIQVNEAGENGTLLFGGAKRTLEPEQIKDANKSEGFAVSGKPGQNVRTPGPPSSSNRYHGCRRYLS